MLKRLTQWLRVRRLRRRANQTLKEADAAVKEKIRMVEAELGMHLLPTTLPMMSPSERKELLARLPDQVVGSCRLKLALKLLPSLSPKQLQELPWVPKDPEAVAQLAGSTLDILPLLLPMLSQEEREELLARLARPILGILPQLLPLLWPKEREKLLAQLPDELVAQLPVPEEEEPLL